MPSLFEHAYLCPKCGRVFEEGKFSVKAAGKVVNGSRFADWTSKEHLPELVSQGAQVTQIDPEQCPQCTIDPNPIIASANGHSPST